mmetsp:Transcript_190/g.498  ORF Transcript_190/g.498 Transcript_190/m.498 type:complete len:212 (+) Transcript_190:62-697(+)|eukprot:CAMPEP_0196757910 /NCGR_PEP_ID=MMETSP1091-20130531/103907_1 /TAXON_ID=302021 /ORGANISM="Rhodomonas sp., Strain CCMP768" /LENGTH=211 /DNA_ID=CAMNT_0042106699 /DNA_START=62 /DNA_END=697 /DNA_ORIENTATION=-
MFELSVQVLDLASVKDTLATPPLPPPICLDPAGEHCVPSHIPASALGVNDVNPHSSRVCFLDPKTDPLDIPPEADLVVISDTTLDKAPSLQIATILNRENSPSRPSFGHCIIVANACTLAALQAMSRGDFTDMDKDAVANAESMSPLGAMLLKRYVATAERNGADKDTCDGIILQDDDYFRSLLAANLKDDNYFRDLHESNVVVASPSPPS